MKKIISLFQRNYETDHLVRDEIVPGAEWVIKGEGVATQKFDGTCIMVRNGGLFKRYDAKHGKTPPEGFEPAQDPDPVTGHWPGWILANDPNADKRLFEACNNFCGKLDNGTYELCGPKIQSNREKLDKHMLIKHGTVEVIGVPRTFDSIKEWLKDKPIEGIVWHHPDGRMVKIKKKNFGLKR